MSLERCWSRAAKTAAPQYSSYCATNHIRKFTKEERSGVGWLLDAGHSGIPA